MVLSSNPSTAPAAPSQPKGAIIPSISQMMVSKIINIYKHLAEHQAQGSLTPSVSVNTGFSSLVRLCEENLPDRIVREVIASPAIRNIVPHLRRICSEGEFRLEMFWAEKLLSGAENDLLCSIHQFPYYGNYIDLTRMELNTLLSVSGLKRPPTKFAFLGSGPLPLTSICLATELVARGYSDTHVHNIDCDATAIDSSRKLVAGLDDHYVSEAMTFEVAHVANVDVALERFDVVYIAALVGMDVEEKQTVLKRIHKAMKPGALIVVRSAHSLRTLLYPPIDMDSLQGFSPLLVVHPYNHVINSVLIARRI
ncbi:hypothetical protein PhCBS80983_g01566 [Powellomyces hirtus]|uniref:Nicotianamine synthase n=1 Tax=Powellomyces hirtus TaxID=109895 RepID=A0A507EAU3_9FUNG|nr:hypothetical protein PhCBS80983_g01566 [Powellomyces hirtus]